MRIAQLDAEVRAGIRRRDVRAQEELARRQAIRERPRPRTGGWVASLSTCAGEDALMEYVFVDAVFESPRRRLVLDCCSSCSLGVHLPVGNKSFRLNTFAHD